AADSHIAAANVDSNNVDNRRHPRAQQRGGGGAPEIPRTELRRLALDDELSLAPQMGGRTRSATRAAADQNELASAAEDELRRMMAWERNEISSRAMARVQAKAQAETVLCGMAEDKCGMTELI
ncbi:unnamed protein product, partial [Sphacelaria rigidula]